MKKFALLMTVVAAVVMVSGCVYSDEQLISNLIKSSPIIKEFTDNYPNAEIKMTRFTTEQTSEIIEQIRSECENNFIEPGNFYRVNITDDASGLVILAWIDINNRTIECIVKKGGGGEQCASHTQTKCYEGHIYWYDSCNEREDKKEKCNSGCEEGRCKGSSNCSSHSQVKCYEGHVYWYNSCGVKEMKKEYCTAGCEEGACKSSGVCTETDNGRDYQNKGCAVKGENELCDHCNDDGTLTEKYCENGEIKAETVECSAGQCEDAICVSSNCTSHSETSCYEGHVYWYNSCGVKETKKEYCTAGCEEGECKTCENQNQTKCYSNDVYWYSSCNVKEERKEDCLYGCDGGECLDYTPAECTGFEYFTFKSFELTANGTELDVKNGNRTITIGEMKIGDSSVVLTSPINITLSGANETISGTVSVGKTQGQEYSYLVKVYYTETNETLIDDATCTGMIK